MAIHADPLTSAAGSHQRSIASSALTSVDHAEGTQAATVEQHISTFRGTHMLGRVLVAAIAGVVMWRYRDSLREYAKGNAGPAREKVDGLLRTVQQTSETLLDQAKQQLSARLGSARERLGAGSAALENDRPKSSDSVAPLARTGSVRFEGK
jgi:hypothetical protein